MKRNSSSKVTPFVHVNPPKPTGLKREPRPECNHEWIGLHDKMGDEEKVVGWRCMLCRTQKWN